MSNISKKLERPRTAYHRLSPTRLFKSKKKKQKNETSQQHPKLPKVQNDLKLKNTDNNHAKISDQLLSEITKRLRKNSKRKVQSSCDQQKLSNTKFLWKDSYKQPETKEKYIIENETVQRYDDCVPVEINNRPSNYHHDQLPQKKIIQEIHTKCKITKTRYLSSENKIKNNKDTPNNSTLINNELHSEVNNRSNKACHDNILLEIKKTSNKSRNLNLKLSPEKLKEYKHLTNRTDSNQPTSIKQQNTRSNVYSNNILDRYKFLTEINNKCKDETSEDFELAHDKTLLEINNNVRKTFIDEIPSNKYVQQHNQLLLDKVEVSTSIPTNNRKSFQDHAEKTPREELLLKIKKKSNRNRNNTTQSPHEQRVVQEHTNMEISSKKINNKLSSGHPKSDIVSEFNSSSSLYKESLEDSKDGNIGSDILLNRGVDYTWSNHADKLLLKIKSMSIYDSGVEKSWNSHLRSQDKKCLPEFSQKLNCSTAIKFNKNIQNTLDISSTQKDLLTKLKKKTSNNIMEKFKSQQENVKIVEDECLHDTGKSNHYNVNKKDTILLSGPFGNRVGFLREKHGLVFLDIYPSCFQKTVEFLVLLMIYGVESVPYMAKVKASHVVKFKILFSIFNAAQKKTNANVGLAKDNAAATTESNNIQSFEEEKGSEDRLNNELVIPKMQVKSSFRILNSDLDIIELNMHTKKAFMDYMTKNGLLSHFSHMSITDDNCLQTKLTNSEQEIIVPINEKKKNCPIRDNEYLIGCTWYVFDCIVDILQLKATVEKDSFPSSLKNPPSGILDFVTVAKYLFLSNDEWVIYVSKTS